MTYFMIKLGTNSAALQPEIMDRLKSMNIDVIQVGDGLVAKTHEDVSDVQDILAKIDSSLTTAPVNPKDPNLAKDVRAFLDMVKHKGVE